MIRYIHETFYEYQNISYIVQYVHRVSSLFATENDTMQVDFHSVVSLLAYSPRRLKSVRGTLLFEMRTQIDALRYPNFPNYQGSFMRIPGMNSAAMEIIFTKILRARKRDCKCYEIYGLGA